MCIQNTPPDAELAQVIADEAEKETGKIIVHSQIVALMAFFLAPFPAGIIAGLSAGLSDTLSQLVSRRIYQRLNALRDAMVSRLNAVEQGKVDKEWFLSEEYQAILFEAARQVTATADGEKIRMLGNALANGGVTEFSEETRKELFVQMIRDLTPQHIAMLRALVPPKDAPFGLRITWEHRPAITPESDGDSAVLQMLAANGLVTESVKLPKMNIRPRFSITMSESEMNHNVSEFIKALQRSPAREFRLSEFGRDFLNFISL